MFKLDPEFGGFALDPLADLDGLPGQFFGALRLAGAQIDRGELVPAGGEREFGDLAAIDAGFADLEGALEERLALVEETHDTVHATDRLQRKTPA